MKNIYLISLLIISTQSLLTQTTCEPPTNFAAIVVEEDVTLSWTPPEFVTFSVKSTQQRINTDKFIDSSPTHKIFKQNTESRDYLDIQFTFPCYDASGETGIVSDGSYIYTSTWNDDYFIKYNLDGTFADTLRIAGISDIRGMVYCEKNRLIYGTQIIGSENNKIIAFDFETLTIVDIIETPYSARGLAYDPKQDVFYTNNWSDDVKVIDRITGNTIDTIPLTGSYSNYYGFAYDNYSAGGPYLWGFSQDNNGADLVQLAFPDLTETGFVLDLSDLSSGGLAGGLFVQPNLINGTVTLGGMIQNEIVFGLELGDVNPPVLSGYNIYRDDILQNSTPLTDTLYHDNNLDPATYTYIVSAVYNDIDGSFHCESDPTPPKSVTVMADPLILGGNVFVGSIKLDYGVASAYSFLGDDYILESCTDIDDLGYYFFFPFQPNLYYIATHPDEQSINKGVYINTYYGDVYHWEESSPIHLIENEYNLDINLIKISPSHEGVGRISGKIISENKNPSVNPATNVSMLLLNTESSCIANNYTDEFGNFSFSDIGIGTYKLLCEIMGKKMTPLEFTIDNNHQIYTDVNFLVSGDEIILGVDDELPESVSFLSEVFPNPATTNAYIEISLTKSESVILTLFDISGKIIESRVETLNIGLNRILVSNSQLSAGINFLNIEFENSLSINKKFIVY
jgi:type IX secretion system substrate protein